MTFLNTIRHIGSNFMPCGEKKNIRAALVYKSVVRLKLTFK
jgi:hypothetical protein